MLRKVECSNGLVHFCYRKLACIVSDREHILSNVTVLFFAPLAQLER